MSREIESYIILITELFKLIKKQDSNTTCINRILKIILMNHLTIKHHLLMMLIIHKTIMNFNSSA